MDRDLMDRNELRAIANYFRGFHGADSFVTALEHARSLAAEGNLTTAAVWNQIAEEISHIETNDVLDRCLKRD
jgi:soluble cytochrome b562